jgi:cation diffusion facilitator family transporter
MSDTAISDPHADQARRVALIAILAGAAIMLVKLGVYGMTHSAAVLSDALESIVNILAAGMMYFAVWLAGQPADRDHPYGHGKVEFMALGFEGGTILAAGCGIGATAIWRLVHPVDLERLDTGTWLIGAVTLLTVILAAYVYRYGKRYAHPVLIADAKHLGTDVLTTVGVFVGLILVQVTHRPWLDPVVALGMTAFILITSWRMLRVSIQGLMDYSDPDDQAAIAAILDD